MNSDPKIKPKPKLELDQEKPSKKSLWQKIKRLISNALERRASEEGKWKDLDDW